MKCFTALVTYTWSRGISASASELGGYREVILSHSFRQPLEQHFGLDGTKRYDVRAIFHPSGKTVDVPSAAAGQRLEITEP